MVVAPQQGSDGVLHVQTRVEARERVANRAFIECEALLFEGNRFFTVKCGGAHFFGRHDGGAIFQDDKKLFDDPVKNDGLITDSEPTSSSGFEVVL